MKVPMPKKKPSMKPVKKTVGQDAKHKKSSAMKMMNREDRQAGF